MNERAPRVLRRMAAIVAAALVVTACAVGPDYRRPDAVVPVQYKEAAPWVAAAPADALERGPWWDVFADPDLAALEARVDVSNQNVAAAVARYDQALATLGGQRATLFPVVSLNAGATRAGAGDTSGAGAFTAGVGANWAPDVWGRLRRGVAGASASAEASLADLAAAKLSAQSELALSYFGLRNADAQKALLDATIEGYQRSLEITQNRYDAGVIARTDVLQAQTQLATSRAEAVGLERQRAQFEHAIAVLVGVPPADFALPTRPWEPVPPEIPAGVPSTLLQRRPDIAAAERRAAAANEQIGIAQAAFYPDITLSASAGSAGLRVGDLFNASALAWTLGASLAQTLFDAGATRAAVAGARAVYAQGAAQYRQTVLTAFADVEDQLVAQRVLRAQFDLRVEAARAAADVQTQTLNRYRAGQVGYTEVVIAQATALNARRALLQNVADRHTTTVALIQALGGGWSDAGLAELPPVAARNANDPPDAGLRLR